MTAPTWTHEHAPRVKGTPGTVIEREWLDAWRIAHANGRGDAYDALNTAMQRCHERMAAATSDDEKTAILARMWEIAERRRQLLTLITDDADSHGT
jgi:hypothetical protein